MSHDQHRSGAPSLWRDTRQCPSDDSRFIYLWPWNKSTCSCSRIHYRAIFSLAWIGDIDGHRSCRWKMRVVYISTHILSPLCRFWAPRAILCFDSIDGLLFHRQSRLHVRIPLVDQGIRNYSRSFRGPARGSATCCLQYPRGDGSRKGSQKTPCKSEGSATTR